LVGETGGKDSITGHASADSITLDCSSSNAKLCSAALGGMRIA